MNYKQDNIKTECDHYCHSCIYNKCRLKTETETKNSKTGGYDYEMR